MCSYSKIHEWQTRLALIKPSEDPSAYLELSLVVVDLVDLNTGAIINHDTLVTYDALSYAWGTAVPSMKCVCDGNTILLRDNLDSALKFLREPQDARYVWIDFLCINQDDLVEKAVQIPRMKNIYSKASTVIAWLGESLPVENMIRRCNEECGPNMEPLTCSNHKDELWSSIFDFAWFRRTWVRQEVFAAERLKVCSPYFSTTWELFAAALLSMYPGFSMSGGKAVENIGSLNELYSSRRLKLLDLLQQGSGFEASVPHDHIFSVLGIMDTPKHSTKGTIPVTYDKTYHEVCGDVTKYIIRESRSIEILRLCLYQRRGRYIFDRSYAFDWPKVHWPDPPKRFGFRKRYPESQDKDSENEFDKWFDIENPLREATASMSSKNTTSSPMSGQSNSGRLLVLYGRAWGTLTRQPDIFTYSSRITQQYRTEAYSVDLGDDESPRAESSSRSESSSRWECSYKLDSSSGINFFVIKSGLADQVLFTHTNDGDVVWWEFEGSARKGDMFVLLEPGPQNILLRKCSTSGDIFEVVAWGDKAKIGSMEAQRESKTIDNWEWMRTMQSYDHLGPRQRFLIR
ncbi:unnamed protein product [Alternaria alternata]